MAKTKKGLVISWFYPPGNSSEGLVTYKLLKNSKFEYDVFTRETSEYDAWDRDVNEDKLVSSNVKIVKSKEQDHERWVQDAVKYFMAHREEYDFIMSRIMPAEAHVAAGIIKKKYPKVKWLASFGDPLVRTPYLKVIDKKENPYYLKQMIEDEKIPAKRWAHLAASPTRFMRKQVWEKQRQGQMIDINRYAKINDEVFKNADVLIFNNDQQYRHAFEDEKMALYQDKGVVIHHSFDEALYPEVGAAAKKNAGAGKKVKFVYVGHLDNLRSPRAILKALDILHGQDKNLKGKAEFEFYGHMDEKDKVYILDHGLTDVVKIHGNIEYFESLKKIEEADWALLIDANFNLIMDEYLFFPAKLVDYLGAKKKILAVSQLRGATADVLRKTGGAKIVTHSANEIALYLSKIIYQGFEPEPYNQKAWAEFDAKNVAKKFDRIVKGVL